MNVIETMLEITLEKSENFLKVKETLERIGIASQQKKTLYQSCHILHKQGKYYIAHFKEMFALDGKFSNFTDEDRARRNTIAGLLEQWGLVKILPEQNNAEKVNMSRIKVISYRDKEDWELVAKYNIGTR